MTLRLQLKHDDRWYDIQCPKDVVDEVDAKERLSSHVYAQYLIDVTDFPRLSEWMRRNYYKQGMAMLTHFPDVKAVPERNLLTVVNIEEEMLKLKQNIRQQQLADDEQPDYVG